MVAKKTKEEVRVYNRKYYKQHRDERIKSIAEHQTKYRVFYKKWAWLDALSVARKREIFKRYIVLITK